jgi:hypothetical protein
MVCSNFLFSSQRISLNKGPVFEIIGVINARKPSYSKRLPSFTNNYRPYLSQEIDILCNPTSKVRFTKRVNSLMIAAYANSQYGSDFISVIIISEAPHFLIFFRTMHIFKILLMPD